MKTKVEPFAFNDIYPEYSDYDKAKAVVLGLPYEHTTSFMKGAKNGPLSMINASAHVELFDDETLFETYEVGINTQYLDIESDLSEQKSLELIGEEYLKHFNNKKFVVGVGGEHSVTTGIIDSLSKVISNNEVSIIQFDAHPDLRDEFEGSSYNHACALRRVHEKGFDIFQLGIRSICIEDHEYIQNNKNITTVYAKELYEAKQDYSKIKQLIKEKTKDKVYITFDVDFFDTSIVSETGTPEPGGGKWFETLELLKYIFENKQVIGADVVELSASDENNYSAFNTASLVKKLIAYKYRDYRTDTVRS